MNANNAPCFVTLSGCIAADLGAAMVASGEGHVTYQQPLPELRLVTGQ